MDKNVKIQALPIHGFSEVSFGNWDERVYATLLSKYLDIPFEDVYRDEKSRWTLMKDEQGNQLPQSFPFDE